jgi:hypothetical protein
VLARPIIISTIFPIRYSVMSTFPMTEKVDLTDRDFAVPGQWWCRRAVAKQSSCRAGAVTGRCRAGAAVLAAATKDKARMSCAIWQGPDDLLYDPFHEVLVESFADLLPHVSGC